MASCSPTVEPRLIIHGGAGNISRKNLSPDAWALYSAHLLRIHRSTASQLAQGVPALDAATHAVALFEDCPLFNCGKGAVFTRNGTIELEASVMTTRGFHKRACAVVLVKHVKNPIRLAREMLVRGETDGAGGGNGGGDGDPAGGFGGAQGHCCLGGETVEKLAKEWGLEIVDESYFWTKRRWDEHRRGLGEDVNAESLELVTPYGFLKEDDRHHGNHIQEYLPQGTVGCVALDRFGCLCVATSTGGLTNKLPLRIGDTPTIGAGFWAEEWNEPLLEISAHNSQDAQSEAFSDARWEQKLNQEKTIRAVAVSGTGNGDSFLRLAAARTVGSIVRFSSNCPANGQIKACGKGTTLAAAINQIAGLEGELQRSAGDRWGKTGEGEGGMIGIDFVDGIGHVEFDFNCGGMFRCWVDPSGQEKVMVFRDDY